MGLLLFALEFASLLLLGAGALLLTHGSLTVAGFPIILLAAPVSCCALAFYYSGLYDLRPFTFAQLTARIGRAIGFAGLALAILYLLFPALRPERDWLASLLTILVVFAVVSLLLHWGVRRILLPREKVLILGTSPLGIEVARHLLEFSYAMLMVGFVDEENTAGRAGLPGPLLGTLEDATTIIARTRPDRIVLATHDYGDQPLLRAILLQRLSGFSVETASQAYERLTGKLVLEDITPDYLVLSGAFRRRRLHAVVKRLISVTVAAAGLVLTLPLMALIAFWIRVTSSGPIFFSQKRIGLHERPFWLIKFRSMHEDRAVRSEWEGDNAHRITRFGRWMRKLHLDELPQLWNILRGDMDFVGPRPHPVSNHLLFKRSIPFYELRSLIRPGLTGWAQVRNGYANDLNGEIHKMKYDLYYVAHPSLLRDLHILLQTVKVVLFGVSAESAPEPSRLPEPSRKREIMGPHTVSP
jgi:exopolysaccharide biosynthesis polyprenyl glycosylphosphotransferase